MKRYVSLILIMMMVLSIASPSFAKVSFNQNNNNPIVYNKPQHNNNWNNGGGHHDHPGNYQYGYGLPGYRPLPHTYHYNRWYPPHPPYYGGYGYGYGGYNPYYHDDTAVGWMVGLTLFQMLLQQSNQAQQQQQMQEFMQNQQILEMTNRVLDEYYRQTR